jgi:hypothetical protein
LPDSEAIAESPGTEVDMAEDNERKAESGDASKREGAQRDSGGGDGSHANGPKHKRTAGKDRDADRSGEARNEGHGHPREERGAPE